MNTFWKKYRPMPLYALFGYNVNKVSDSMYLISKFKVNVENRGATTRNWKQNPKADTSKLNCVVS